MECWFCRADRPGSEEHIIPLAVGGRLTTWRVCKPCNSRLGNDVDSALNNHPLVQIRRSELRLAGQSGIVPDGMAELMKRATLVSEPEQKVRVTTGPDGRIDTRLIYHEKDIIEPDGTIIKRISIDARDRDQLPKIIQGQRKRHGHPPLSPEALAAQVEALTAQVQRLEHPEVQTQAAIDLVGFRPALLKIVYELGCLWLGDAYLDDPNAGVLRDLIFGREEIENFPTVAGARLGVPPMMREFFRDRDEHFVLAFRSGQVIQLQLAIFNQFFASVRLTEQASKYVPEAWPGRVIRQSLARGTCDERTVWKEIERLYHQDQMRDLMRSTAVNRILAQQLLRPH